MFIKFYNFFKYILCSLYL